MNPVRIGRIVRTLRRRLGWRQVDLARRARVSQQTISLIETGQIRRVSIATLERVLMSLEAELELFVRWRGGELDRLLDEAHATVSGATADFLDVRGWIVRVETTYAIGRDRGSIDVFAFHPGSESLVVGEVKVDFTSAEATLRRHDEKVRLARAIARERFGWVARSVSRLLVLPESTTSRRRIERHEALLSRAYLCRGRQLTNWLLDPTRPMAGLLFLPPTKDVGGRRTLTSRRRIRPSRPGAAEHGLKGADASRAPARRRSGA
jgi:transcriptional regulator with XRE-family HTH domain